jgi:hypothetical protein
LFSKLIIKLIHQSRDEFAIGSGRGEQAANVGVGAPRMVTDHLAAAVVDDLKAQLSVPLVRLVEGRVAERAPMLFTLKTKQKLIYNLYIINSENS